MSANRRILAIDWLRGLVMLLMALDHVRYFFTNVPFPPEDVTRTWPALFLTRWITHYCAPAFFLLAGMSAWLGRASTRFLATRGLWLILLEVTVIGFGWKFTPGYSFAGVIWALGWSMIALSLLGRLPREVLFALAVTIIVIPMTGPPSLLFRPGGIEIAGHRWWVLYPVVPWLGLMLLGHAAAFIWEMEPPKRQRILFCSGALLTALFVALRQKTHWIAFLNTEKYPPSLEFTLMTIGPSLAVLAVADRMLQGRAEGHGELSASGVVLTFGRVPFFYYLCHLYLIHLLALALAVATGQPHGWLSWMPPAGKVPPAGYGYGLPVVWIVWLGVVAILYVPCRWFESLKRRSTHPMLRYL